MLDKYYMKIEVSTGEIFDKWTILNIKLEKIKDEEALENVKREYNMLSDVMAELMNSNQKIFKILLDYRDKLESINTRLWEVEDDLRRMEASRQFDYDFIHLARAVYQNNDKRAEIKKTINQLTKSKYVEEKQYTKYT